MIRRDAARFLRRWLLPTLLGLGGYRSVSALFAPILLATHHPDSLGRALVIEAGLSPVQILCGGFANYYSARVQSTGRAALSHEFYVGGLVVATCTAPLVALILVPIVGVPLALAGAFNACSLSINGAWILRLDGQPRQYTILVLSQTLVSACVLGFSVLRGADPVLYILAQPVGAVAGQVSWRIRSGRGLPRPRLDLIRESTSFLAPELVQWSYWNAPIFMVGILKGASRAAIFGTTYKFYFVFAAFPALLGQLITQAMGSRKATDRAIIGLSVVSSLALIPIAVAALTVLPLPAGLSGQRLGLSLIAAQVLIFAAGMVYRISLARDNLRRFVAVTTGTYSFCLLTIVFVARFSSIQLLAAMVVLETIMFIGAALLSRQARPRSPDRRSKVTAK